MQANYAVLTEANGRAELVFYPSNAMLVPMGRRPVQSVSLDLAELPKLNWRLIAHYRNGPNSLVWEFQKTQPEPLP